MNKFIGKVGHGQAIHILTDSVHPIDNTVSYWTVCGADHATNKSAPRKRVLSPLDVTKVTCKKCLNSLKVI